MGVPVVSKTSLTAALSPSLAVYEDIIAQFFLDVQRNLKKTPFCQQDSEGYTKPSRIFVDFLSGTKSLAAEAHLAV